MTRPVDHVRVSARDLPTGVVQARIDIAADDAANEEVARPRIEAVLTACKLTAAELEVLHRGYADSTDLDMTGYSRGAALWLLSGRVLGLLRALLVQVEAGICNEAVVTGRAIHEAARVLVAFSVPDADDLVRVFLDDEGRHGYVKQAAARKAEERYEEELAQEMESAGLPRVPSALQAIDELYDRMSRVAHNRRSSCLDAFHEPSQTMSYGVHPSPIRRAGYAEWAASMTIEVINVVGDALRALYSQPEFFTKRMVPLVASIQAVREAAPLDEQAIRNAAGTGSDSQPGIL